MDSYIDDKTIEMYEGLAKENIGSHVSYATEALASRSLVLIDFIRKLKEENANLKNQIGDLNISNLKLEAEIKDLKSKPTPIIIYNKEVQKKLVDAISDNKCKIVIGVDNYPLWGIL